MEAIVNGSHCRRQSSRRQIKNGYRRAAKKAITAARLYLCGYFPTLQEAAEACGSNIPYVRAAIVVLQTENLGLLADVLAGWKSLMKAAREGKRLAELVGAFRAASAHDRVSFAKTIGPTTLFDTVLVPAEAVKAA